LHIYIYIYIHTVGESYCMLTTCQVFTMSATCAVVCSRTYSIFKIVVATRLLSINILRSPHVTDTVTPARNSGLAKMVSALLKRCLLAVWRKSSVCITGRISFIMDKHCTGSSKIERSSK
jgi:hypothetical protein